MGFQAVPDTAEVVISYMEHGRNMKNVVHAVKSGGYDLSDLISLALAVDFKIGTNWLPIQTQDALYVDTTVRGLAFENDQEVVNALNTGVGLVIADALPGNVTFSVKRLSGLTGRSARGRLYWIGIPNNAFALNENQLDPVKAQEISDAVDTVRSGISATAWTAAIVSRYSGGSQRAVGVTFDWIDTLFVDVNIDSQRRRLA